MPRVIVQGLFQPKDDIKNNNGHVLNDKGIPAYGKGGRKHAASDVMRRPRLAGITLSFAHQLTSFYHDMKWPKYISYYWVRIWYFELLLESVCCGVMLQSGRESE